MLGIPNAAFHDGVAETEKVIGVPVVMSNKVGRLKAQVPGGFPEQDAEFPGYGTIADGNGKLLSNIIQEGRRCHRASHIKLGSKGQTKRPSTARTLVNSNAVVAFIWPLTQKIGECSYRNNHIWIERALGIKSK